MSTDNIWWANGFESALLTTENIHPSIQRVAGNRLRTANKNIQCQKKKIQCQGDTVFKCYLKLKSNDKCV